MSIKRGQAASGVARVTAGALGAFAVALVVFALLPGVSVGLEATPTVVTLTDDARVALASEIASSLAGLHVVASVSNLPSAAVPATVVPPVLTRGDYDRYEVWAQVVAGVVALALGLLVGIKIGGQ